MAEDKRIRLLSDLMAEEGLLPLARMLVLVGQIVEALRAATERGVDVGALDPRAILMSEEMPGAAGPSGRSGSGLESALEDPTRRPPPRVSGFAPSDEFSIFGGTASGAAYLAPELQGSGAPGLAPILAPSLPPILGPLARQFSLAVIAYEMLAGCSPFSDDPAEIPAASLDGEVPTGPLPRSAPTPISELVVDIPGGLDAIFARALDPEPERRFPSVEDFVVALRDIANPGAVWDDGATVVWSPQAGDMPGFEAPPGANAASTPPSQPMEPSPSGAPIPGWEIPPATLLLAPIPGEAPSPGSLPSPLAFSAPEPDVASPLEAEAPLFAAVPHVPISGRPSRRMQLSFVAAAVALVVGAVTLMSASRRTIPADKAVSENAPGATVPAFRPRTPSTPPTPGATPRTASVAAPADATGASATADADLARESGHPASAQSRRGATHRPGTSRR